MTSCGPVRTDPESLLARVRESWQTMSRLQAGLPVRVPDLESAGPAEPILPLLVAAGLTRNRCLAPP